MKINFKQIIHLKLYGWIFIDNKYYVKCKLHGITEAVLHGWHQDVTCLECLESGINDFDFIT
jgi:hypothetical protein